MSLSYIIITISSPSIFILSSFPLTSVLPVYYPRFLPIWFMYTHTHIHMSNIFGLIFFILIHTFELRGMDWGKGKKEERYV